MVIFDLDQTLINSTVAEPLRRASRWEEVYALIPSLEPFAGITALLEELRKFHVPMAIVTSSPRLYCSRVVKHWGWPIGKIVAYHDTAKHKPSPEPILKAISDVDISRDDVFHVGDMPSDTQAAKAAGVVSLGALWGSPKPEALTGSDPDYLFSTVEEITRFLTEYREFTIP